MKNFRLPEGFVPPVFHPVAFLPGMEDPDVVEFERMEFLRAAVRRFRRELRVTIQKPQKVKPRDELTMEFDFHFSADFAQLGLDIDDLPDVTGGIASNGHSGMSVDLERPDVHIRKPVVHAEEPVVTTERRGRGRRRTNPIFKDQVVYWSEADKMIMRHELLEVSLKCLAGSGNAEEKADVLVWLFCPNEDEVVNDFSFEQVCAHLNMDADLIRLRLVKEFRKFIPGEEIIFTFEKWYDHTFKNGKTTQILVPVKYSLDLTDTKPLVELETLTPDDAPIHPACFDEPLVDR